MHKIYLPLTAQLIKELKSGDEVLLSGIIYTARDKAHQRLADLLKKGKGLPIPLNNQVVYYCGPTATPSGKIIGSCGPTTSSRMDKFTPALIKMGLRGMIGKGSRSKEVIEAIKKYKAVYFLAVGGAGALLSKFIKQKERVAFKDLGPEAIYKLKVRDFPLIVAIDAKGKNIYRNVRKEK